MARRGPGGARFRVGQIISHKRFSYRGVIIGWDHTCEAEEIWMAQMNVDALPSAPAHAPCYAAGGRMCLPSLCSDA